MVHLTLLSGLFLFLVCFSTFGKSAHVIRKTIRNESLVEGRLYKMTNQSRGFGLDVLYDYFSSFIDEMNNYVSDGVIGEALRDYINCFALPATLEDGDISDLSDFDKSALCMICDLGVSSVLSAYYLGFPHSYVESIAVGVCTLFGLQSPKVCEGILNSNLDIILYIADRMGNLTSQQFCGTVLEGFHCYGPEPVVHWEVDLSSIGDKPKFLVLNDNLIKSDKSGDSINIVQITDLHFDYEYLIGSKVLCGDPLCCRKDNGLAENPDEAAGPWGDYRHCDIPWYIIDSTISNIAANHGDAEFIYMTGDIIAHNVWSTSKEKNAQNIKYSGEEFHRILGPKIYPILGNHEPHPSNVFAPPYITDEKSTVWLYESFFDSWGSILPPEAKETFLIGGYYTVSPKPGFRLIALNTMFGYIFNWWLIMDPVDPAGQLEWLAKTLYEAEKNKEKVHILTHIPPGTPDTLMVWSKEFARIVHRFEDTIMGEFNGHTHKEQFNVYIHENRARSVAFNAGSVTPFVNSNPNYRIYKVDSSTWEIKDYDTYVYNLTEANIKRIGPPSWYKLYSFKEAYGVESLHPEQIRNLVYEMARNKNLLQLYNRYYIKAGDAGLATECDSACQETRLCEIVTTISGDSTQCNELMSVFKGTK